DMRSCSFAAGGLLSPISEFESGESPIHVLGHRALDDWQEVFDQLETDAPLNRGGGLYAASRGEEGLLKRTINRIQMNYPNLEVHSLSPEEIQSVCPGLSERVGMVHHFQGEGQVDVPKT